MPMKSTSESGSTSASSVTDTPRHRSADRSPRVMRLPRTSFGERDLLDGAAVREVGAGGAETARPGEADGRCDEDAAAGAAAAASGEGEGGGREIDRPFKAEGAATGNGVVGRAVVDQVAHAVTVRVLRHDVRRAGRARAGAELGRVADAGRGAALGRGGLIGVGRASVGGSVALLGRVAGAGRRTALRGALRVGRTGGARPGAALGTSRATPTLQSCAPCSVAGSVQRGAWRARCG